MGESISSFPLFPLGLVLLPGEVVPLHIFEERYKLMIGECLEDDHEFGVVWVADDGVKETGCAARVTQLVDRADDGEMNILVQGTKPFRLERRIEDLPYPAGDIELLDEEDDEPLAGADGAADAARDRYADIVERVTDSRPTVDDLNDLDAYGMAATLDFALEAKQDLLELRSEHERLDRLAALFEAAIEQLDHAEVAAERARGNGKVHFRS